MMKFNLSIGNLLLNTVNIDIDYTDNDIDDKMTKNDKS